MTKRTCPGDSEAAKEIKKHLNHSQFIVEFLFDQTANGSFCDIILKVEDQEMFAHKCVLASNGDYFETLLDTLEEDKHSIPTVPIKNISAKTFRIILKWMYTGKIGFSKKNLVDLLEGTQLLELPDMRRDIMKAVNMHTNKKNAFDFLDSCWRFSIEEFRKFYVDFFQKNFEELLFDPRMLSLPKDFLDEILPSDKLRVKKEKTVYDFVLRWINHDLEARRGYFLDMFKHVRLPFIYVEDLATVILKNEFVQELKESKDLVTEAMMHYDTSDAKKMLFPRFYYADYP